MPYMQGHQTSKPFAHSAYAPFLVLEPNPKNSLRYAYETTAISVTANLIPIAGAMQNLSLVPVALLCTVANMAFQGAFWNKRAHMLGQRQEFYINHQHLLVLDYKKDAETAKTYAFNAQYARINVTDMPETLIDAGGPCLEINDTERQACFGMAMTRPELENARQVIKRTLHQHLRQHDPYYG